MFCYLIDDDSDDQDFLLLAMREINPAFQLMTASHAIEALEHLRSPEVVPDVIFLDLNMPMIDGWECLERLRRMSHLAATPVVIYSTSEPPSENLTNKKGTLFLTKQPRISQLVIKLKAIFSQIETGHLC